MADETFSKTCLNVLKAEWCGWFAQLFVTGAFSLWLYQLNADECCIVTGAEMFCDSFALNSYLYFI